MPRIDTNIDEGKREPLSPQDFHKILDYYQASQHAQELAHIKAVAEEAQAQGAAATQAPPRKSAADLGAAAGASSAAPAAAPPTYGTINTLIQELAEASASGNVALFAKYMAQLLAATQEPGANPQTVAKIYASINGILDTSVATDLIMAALCAYGGSAGLTDAQAESLLKNLSAAGGALGNAAASLLQSIQSGTAYTFNSSYFAVCCNRLAGDLSTGALKTFDAQYVPGLVVSAYASDFGENAQLLSWLNQLQAALASNNGPAAGMLLAKILENVESGQNSLSATAQKAILSAVNSILGACPPGVADAAIVGTLACYGSTGESAASAYALLQNLMQVGGTIGTAANALYNDFKARTSGQPSDLYNFILSSDPCSIYNAGIDNSSITAYWNSFQKCFSNYVNGNVWTPSFTAAMQNQVATSISAAALPQVSNSLLSNLLAQLAADLKANNGEGVQQDLTELLELLGTTSMSKAQQATLLQAIDPLLGGLNNSTDLEILAAEALAQKYPKSQQSNVVNEFLKNLQGFQGWVGAGVNYMFNMWGGEANVFTSTQWSNAYTWASTNLAGTLTGFSASDISGVLQASADFGAGIMDPRQQDAYIAVSYIARLLAILKAALGSNNPMVQQLEAEYATVENSVPITTAQLQTIAEMLQQANGLLPQLPVAAMRQFLQTELSMIQAEMSSNTNDISALNAQIGQLIAENQNNPSPTLKAQISSLENYVKSLKALNSQLNLTRGPLLQALTAISSITDAISQGILGAFLPATEAYLQQWVDMLAFNNAGAGMCNAVLSQIPGFDSATSSYDFGSTLASNPDITESNAQNALTKEKTQAGKDLTNTQNALAAVNTQIAAIENNPSLTPSQKTALLSNLNKDKAQLTTVQNDLQTLITDLNAVHITGTTATPPIAVVTYTSPVTGADLTAQETQTANDMTTAYSTISGQQQQYSQQGQVAQMQLQQTMTMINQVMGLITNIIQMVYQTFMGVIQNLSR